MRCSSLSLRGAVFLHADAFRGPRTLPRWRSLIVPMLSLSLALRTLPRGGATGSGPLRRVMPRRQAWLAAGTPERGSHCHE